MALFKSRAARQAEAETGAVGPGRLSRATDRGKSEQAFYPPPLEDTLPTPAAPPRKRLFTYPDELPDVAA